MRTARDLFAQANSLPLLQARLLRPAHTPFPVYDSLLAEEVKFFRARPDTIELVPLRVPTPRTVGE